MAPKLPPTSLAPRPPRLLDASVGEVVTVLAIDRDHLDELALEGVHVGSLLTIRGRAPLGGPLVVGVGRARVAVARSVAATVAIESPALAEADRRPA